jgi:hypothetical protein
MRSNAQVWRHGALLALLGGVLTIGASGCTSEETVVTASLREFAIDLSQTSALEGVVTFQIANNGAHEHEFVLIRTDLAADTLPTEVDGTYLENAAGTLIVDEDENIPPGAQAELTLDLDTDNYVIICNRVAMQAGETIGHYALGMRTSFDVLKN